MKPSVLIVENERSIRESLSKALSGDYITYQAFNGKEAIELITKHGDIKVVLTDLMMPEMGGIELIEELRDEGRDVIIILMTAVPSEEAEHDAMMKGADFFLSKPIDLNKLEILISTLLKVRKQTVSAK